MGSNAAVLHDSPVIAKTQEHQANHHPLVVLIFGQHGVSGDRIRAFRRLELHRKGASQENRENADGICNASSNPSWIVK